MSETPRLPSHDLDAERSLLGSLLLDGSRLSDARDLIDEGCFYHSAHGHVFAAMCRLEKQAQPIDNITLSDQLKRDGRLEAVGGRAYLAELLTYVPSASNLVSYCTVVRDHARRRQLSVLGQELVDQGYQNQPVDDAIEQAERALYQLRHRTGGTGFQPVGDTVGSRLDHLEALYRGKVDTISLPSGFASLDRITGGFHREDLIVIGGRPSMGKTSLGLGFARHAAIELGRPVAFFSLEMSRAQVVDRILSAEARVDSHAMSTGRIDAACWQRLAMAAQRLEGAPLFIDDDPVLSIARLRSQSRRVKAKHGADLILVDYLGLLQVSKAESRQQAIADLSRDLKLLARELQTPIIALTQLNRNLEYREDRRPMLSDLRDSGAIEQDADVVIFIYRDEVYNPESSDRGIAEILVRKHRNGPTGDVRVGFIERLATFEDMAGEMVTA